MSVLITNTLVFAQRWREAANASQSEHRFRSHTKEELKSFERMRKREPKQHQ